MVPGISSRTRLINSKGQIEKIGGKNVQNLFLLIHATKCVSLNILKIYPRLCCEIGFFGVEYQKL